MNSTLPARIQAALICFIISALTITLVSGLEIVQQANQQQSQQHQIHIAPSNLLLYKSNLVKPDAELIELLRNGMNHNHNDNKINSHQANLAWRLMRQNALEFARDRVSLLRPQVERLLSQSNVSLDCSKALGGMLDRIAKLDTWAFQMYNSFGDFPANGLLEGSLNSMGSFESCVDVAPNSIIGQAQYCSFAYQPILPKRPLYHNILEPIEHLGNFTKPDELFHAVAHKAQYLYYIKLRIAACLPTKCSRSDLELLGKQVGQNAFLQLQSLNCLTKSEGFKPDGAQIFALIILGALASVTLLGTLVHALNLKATFIRMNSGPISINGLDVNPDAETEADDDDEEEEAFEQQSANVNQHQAAISLLGKNIKSSLSNLNINNSGSQIGEQANVLQINPTPSNDASLTLTTSGRRFSRHSMNQSLRNSSILRMINVLINFSIIKNGKKLFDTTTSRKQGNVGMDVLGPNANLANTGTGGKSRIIIRHHQTGGKLGAVEVEMLDATSSLSSSSSSSPTRVNQSTSVARPRSEESIDIHAAGMGQASDISCVHGLRFWTISWIIFAHTMQYAEWADFARAYQVEYNITNLWLHPFLNATFSVDTFFLISGLLTTYVTWSISGGSYQRFNKFAFLISRYLRLTPQVLIVILCFILFPLLGDGPYWKGMIQKQADNCRENWWVNALYLQAFVREDRICNVVTWWLSIEMFFHFMSIFIIIALLKNARKGILTAAVIGLLMTAVSCFNHYRNGLPPNMMPTILQRFEVWDSLILEYFWSPFPHATAYIVGLMLGYVLSIKSKIQLSRRQVRLGWSFFVLAYTSILFGTYWWNNNYPYTKFVSTFYYNASQVAWAFSTGWAILACASGNGGWLNTFLSAPIFVPLGRSTYMTYLSHMIIVLSYPAKMQLPIEPSQIVFLYIFVSNLFLSYVLGIFLTLVYESPILHLQKILVTKLARKCLEPDTCPTPSFNHRNRNLSNDNTNDNNNNINQDDLDSITKNKLQLSSANITDDVPANNEQNAKTSRSNKLMARSDPC